MKFFANIWLYLLLVLPGCIGNSWAAPAADTSAEIAQAEKPESHSTHPFDQPSLFNIYHQAEHACNSSTNVPVPLLVLDEQDQSLVYRSALLGRELQDQAWFAIFETPNRKFTHLSLIFPFHSFL
ncbi:hypothetical protein [Fodinibius sp. Rm-B-1B1-1]|uniref:hypothetical protein n=1 Tax=Fodinibius alkaliphilus TaxID=3140241 RepID=UPI003159B11B